MKCTRTQVLSLFLSTVFYVASALLLSIKPDPSFVSCIADFQKNGHGDILQRQKLERMCASVVKFEKEKEMNASRKLEDMGLHTDQISWITALSDIHQNGQQSVPLNRREYRLLNNHERMAFHDAVNAMKTTKIGSSDVSEYDTLVMLHTSKFAPGAHNGAGFLPWHRHFLYLFERALQSHNPAVALPYWDSTLENALEDPSLSHLWSPSFLGNANGEVRTGPFAEWTTSLGGPLIRTIRPRTKGLMTEHVVESIVSAWSLGSTSCIGNCTFEVAHDNIHVFMGGHMSVIPLAPEDPIFFLHHAFIDYLFEEFRMQQLRRGVQIQNDYPTYQFGSPFHAPNREMHPFPNMLNIDALSDVYTRNFYKYASRPKCPDCGHSPSLVCNSFVGRCIARLAEDQTNIQANYEPFCIGKTCGSRDLVYIPIKIAYVHNLKYRYPFLYREVLKYGSNVCGKSPILHVEAAGDNYDGIYTDVVRLNHHFPYSRIIFLGIRNPEIHGIANFTVSAVDECGRSCVALHTRQSIPSDVPHKLFSISLTLSPKTPLQYSPLPGGSKEDNVISLYCRQ